MRTQGKGECRHCQRKVHFYGRGLCKVCHSDLYIRGQYQFAKRQRKEPRPMCQYCHVRAARSKRHGWCKECGRKRHQAEQPTGEILPTKAPQPTRATPGSQEKIDILAARYAAGEYLHHPADAAIGEQVIASVERRSTSKRVALDRDRYRW